MEKPASDDSEMLDCDWVITVLQETLFWSIVPPKYSYLLTLSPHYHSVVEFSGHASPRGTETIYFTWYTSKYPPVSPVVHAEDVLRSRDISELQEKLDASESDLREVLLGKWRPMFCVKGKNSKPLTVWLYCNIKTRTNYIAKIVNVDLWDHVTKF